MDGRAETARPKVSVVIPIYRVEEYLVECLESVVHQTLQDLEIILVDEGEQDRCREIIDFYEQNDPRVVAIHEPNPGASYGAKMNRGLDRATGEFIGIVEPDDFIGAEMYERMYACAVRTGANIVKTSFYDYRAPDDVEVSKSREYINANVPQGEPFSIFQFPALLAAHPSIWSAIYRTEELRRQNIRFVEAPGAGYADNPFYVDAYVRMGKVLWLDEPFYRWRISSGSSSSLPKNWKHDAMLERWNRNLDMYPPDAEENRALAPGFANQAYSAILRRYMKGWTFNEKQYAALTAYLRRFSAEQLSGALRISDKQRQLLVQCRNDPDGFRAKYFPDSLPQEKGMRSFLSSLVRRVRRLLAKDRFEATAFRGTVYLLLLALAVRAGAFGELLPQAVCGVLSPVCAALSALGAVVWAASVLERRRANKQPERKDKAPRREKGRLSGAGRDETNNGGEGVS